MNRALLQQALDALDGLEQNYGNLWQFSKTPEELDSLLNTLRAELEKPEPEKAYICNGCGAIYWESNVSCDCAVPALNQFTLADVYTKGTP